MRFGIVLHVSATYASWRSFSTLAKKAEQLGYDSVWLSDHFISPDSRSYGLETWTMLSALASQTRDIRLGTYVLCNQFRHPSLLARMASTLDIISKGRLELGIGAGWNREEHVAFGFDWDKHSKRVERLKETVEIIKKLWTEDHICYNGRYFQLKDATLKPKPIQKPCPHVWVGGNSEAIRNVVAEVGDGWIPVLPTPKQIAAGVMQIKGLMSHIGRDSEKLLLAYGGSGCALIAEKEESVRKLAVSLARSLGKPLEESACIVGTPVQCIRRVEQYQKAGAQEIVAGFYDFPSAKGLKLFATRVIPHFK